MIANREYFRKNLESIMKENEDYYIIKNKKSLAKGGAEKLASGFRLQAKFEIDKEAHEIFKDINGLIAYRCKLYDQEEKYKGEGGGADTLARNDNDPNKTIKMAQKRAYIDAIIRTTGLSDIFTQDLEDMNKNDISPKYTPKTVHNTKFKAYKQNNSEENKHFIKNPNETASLPQKNMIDGLLNDIAKDIMWLEKKTGLIFDKLTKGQASEIIKQLKNKKEKMFREADSVDKNLPSIDVETGEIIDAEIIDEPIK